MNSHLHPNWSADLSTLMKSVYKMPLSFLIWLFYLPRLSRAYRRWGWKGQPRLFKMEWKSPHNLAPSTPFLCHHFFHTTSLQETAPGFQKLHSVFGNSLMLSALCLELLFPLLHVAKFYSTFMDKFQPLLGKVFPDSYLFFPSQNDYLPLQQFFHSKSD